MKLTHYLPVAFLFWNASVLCSASVGTASAMVAVDSAEFRERVIDNNLMSDEAGQESIADGLMDNDEPDESLFQEYEESLENLDALRAEPLNLNAATAEDLSEIPFLSPLQITELLSYRKRYAELKTVQELRLIRSFDHETIRRLLPFVAVRPTIPTTPLWQSLRTDISTAQHQIIARTDAPLYSRKGYREANDEEYWESPNNYYLGPNISHSLRYQMRKGNRLRIGITASNDYGEPFFARHNRYGYDSYHLYAYYRTDGLLRAIALGTYKAAMGEGLVMGSGFLTGKQTSLPTNAGNAQTLTPHSSTDEYNYLNGAALTIAPLPQWQLTALYSRREIDGRTAGDTLLSIQTDGYHRLLREMQRENAAVIQSYGGVLKYDGSTFNISLNAIAYDFSKDYQRAHNYYNTHYFRGKHGYNTSLSYKLHFHHTLLSGEAALDPNGNIATIHNLRYNLPRSWQAIAIVRHYSPRYASLYARSFEEGGDVRNETGAYFALEGEPLRHIRITAFFDAFKFSHPKYLMHHPSRGYEAFLKTVYKPNTKVELLAYYRYKDKGRDLTSSATDDEDPQLTVPYRTHRLRIQLRYSPLPDQLSLQTLLQQIQVGHARHSKSTGYLIGQSIDHKANAFPLQLNLSCFYFHTDDYASRLYAYEKGLLYSFSYPPLDGHGIRYASTLRYDYSSTLTLILKYGCTQYFDRPTLSTALQQINASHKDDISLQLRLKL